VAKKPVRRKLKPEEFEWTDAAILSFENKAEEESKGNSKDSLNEDNGVPIVSVDPEDMDVMIARIQRRKRAEAQRKKRLASQPKAAPQPPTVLSEFTSVDGEENTAERLAASLNAFFGGFLKANAHLVDDSVVRFPLHYFDSSIYDENNKLTTDMLPLQYSACLVPVNPEDEPDFSTGVRSIGTWSPCMVHDITVARAGQDSEHLLYDVELLGDLNYGERVQLPRIYLCFSLPHDVPAAYGERVRAALRVRRDAVSLLKYTFFVDSMPFSESVASSLGLDQGNRILARTYNSPRLQDLDRRLVDEEMTEARVLYESVMNKIIFDANMMSSTNVQAFKSFALPQEAFPLAKEPPYMGVITAVPKHPMKQRVTTFLAEAFFASAPALLAMQRAVESCFEKQSTVIINMLYDKTFSLDKYERSVSEQMLQAQRHLKQEWPNKTGGHIRRIFAEHAELVAEAKAKEIVLGEGFQKKETASVTGPFYDVAIRILQKYNVEGNPIRLLLEKVNFIMGVVLTDLITKNIQDYTVAIEELCACVVDIKDVRSISVSYPPNSIYKRCVLPAMFSVAFRVSSEDHCLNPKAVEESEAALEEWRKSQAAQDGEKCPLKPV
jgi:hypothetical protein